MNGLPRLMVAPNGARLGKSDHPAIPISLPELTKTARDCYAAGADGLHLHLRDADGQHVLDSGRYREAIAELAHVVPRMAIQITTEAVGIYNPAQQRRIALNSGAQLVSTSIRELMTDTDPETTRRFFDACEDAGIATQFILYDMADVALLRSVMPGDLFRSHNLQILFVLGRYAANRDSNPEDLQPFLDWMSADSWHPDWAVCAFGRGETACLKAAHDHGGKLRVGFENSLWSADKTIARDNAQRVREIVELIQEPTAL